MIFLDKPYASPFLADTLAKTQAPVFIQNVSVPSQSRLNVTSLPGLLGQIREQKHYPLLTTSENAFELLEKHLPDSQLVRNISLFKNKINFRKWMKQIDPSFFFLELPLHELSQLDPKALPFPVILKPAVGYASWGVYRITNEQEWFTICEQLHNELLLSDSLYSGAVFDSTTFIVEEWIQGDEYAIDAYFDYSGAPVIVNVFKRMFLHENDTSDRIYFTSKAVLQESIDSIKAFLETMGSKANLVNFPLHLEVRIKRNGQIAPIEVNPLRFAGIGTTELGYFAYGVNPYEAFIQQDVPDWDNIQSTMDDSVYSFFCADIPTTIHPDSITEFNVEALKKQFSHLLHSYMPNDPRTLAVLFYRTDRLEDNQKYLELDLSQYIKHSESIVSNI
ncbi:ATP-grasp domain-containing protein [Brevibacillus sp. SYSU BS000544]|uniref:ATP-grasp domain-containing protein n=1 Tax=Brevibacillus sp. SYSU BS000544 TaxID=3416443 RepID=UPI003CE51354